MRLTLATAAAIVVSVVVGVLVGPWVGAALFGIVVVIALVAYLRAPNPERNTPLEDAVHESHPHGAARGRRRVLVVANETLAGSELRDLIDGGAVEVDVLAPVLSSHLHYGVSDIDHEIQDAQRRLERSLAWAREQGIDVRGQVGDPNPTTALEDALRDFGADEVIVVTHPRERETWQEHGELERLRRELDVPVTHYTVG